MKEKITEILLLLLIVFIFHGCLKDESTNPFNLKFENGAELLVYLESQGDYINSTGFPSLVPASEVYANLNNYLLVDLRPPEDFAKGHIRNAVNIKPENLLNYFKSIDTFRYFKIIIISSTGQAASYFGCLLILDGYSNVYVMNYGMAAWNSDFSSPWFDAIAYQEGPASLTQDVYYKAEYSKLPSITFSDTAHTPKSKLEERINILLKKGFEESLQDIYFTPVDDFEKVISHSNQNYYLICLGTSSFYKSFWGIQHPVGAVNYDYTKPNDSDLESVSYLQTIPSDKTVYLYSYTGHVSAFVSAYLRILGYDARSILFGGNNIIRAAMLSTPGLEQYVFTQNDVNNFEYITEN